MITRLIWTTWTSLSAVRERPLNFNHSLVGSRHILVRLYACETTDVPPMCCFNVQTEMKFQYSRSCLHRVGVVQVWYQFARSSKTLEARRVVSQTQNKTEKFLDATRNALQYIPIGWISQNGHFLVNITRWALYLPEVGEWLPGVIYLYKVKHSAWGTWVSWSWWSYGSVTMVPY